MKSSLLAPKPVSGKSLSYISPTHLISLLNGSKHLRNATQIHAQLVVHSYISSPFILRKLLDLYSKCGHIFGSLALFSASDYIDSSKNVYTYTTLIAHLSHCNFSSKALVFFQEMRARGILPNEFTFSAILPVCGEFRIGQGVHSLICKHGFESDVFVSSALVDMYAKCGEMGCAMRVFDEMPVRNLVSWNTMIVGFLRNDRYNDAMGFFVSLIAEDLIIPDQVSFSGVLSACANALAESTGRQVHGLVVKHGLESLSYVKNSLMDMYCKCGLFESAKKLFTSGKNGDVVAWNVMMMGFVQSGEFEGACSYFWDMRLEGILPDETSFSTVLHAAAAIGTLEKGASIHSHVIKTGFTENTFVTSALITMYAKCGSLFDAKRTFAENKDHNVISWTAMISACQQHGAANEVIELFENMLQLGIKPDYITFVSVLSACGHTERVRDGFSYFDSMKQKYDINPGLEHYACIVDLLGRSGQLHDAKEFIEKMPIEPDASVWGALLGACRKHSNIDIGREVAERLFNLEPDNPGNYVLLYNMYARRGKSNEASEVRRLMGFNRIRKEPGCSWIDVRNTTHVFKAHDRSHSMANEIYQMLRKVEELVKQKGYVPQFQYTIDDADEERGLWYHSEKLALAYGLLILPKGAPIRIKKNLRTCDDCHVVMKLASEIFEREIIVRDINRFHKFAYGSCSCGDYW